MESKRISRHIDRLILDPNNYRFIDRQDYKLVNDEEAADNRVQQRTLNFILGKNQSNVQDLISSFRTNGFLDIDQIQVKALGDKYLVLEGNRRIATLKYLWEEYKSGGDVGNLEESDFKIVHLVEMSDEDPVQHLITMGLHHISGKKRWSAVNEAQLINDLIERFSLHEEEVCDKLGINKHKLRRSRRTLSFIEQYKRSDYGDQFEPNMFTIFETAIATSSLKNWVGWDDTAYFARNEGNVERFFKWISKEEEYDLDEDGNERSNIIEPIITQYRQVKEISAFINDENAVKKMEESRSIIEGYTYSDAISENRLKSALSKISSEIQVAFNFSDHLNIDEYEEIEKLKIKLDRLIPSSLANLGISANSSSLFYPSIRKQFSSVYINKYRKLTNLKVQKLSQVNIFVGGNNMGKTSLLEVFYLLSQLNDLNAFVQLEKYRGKYLGDINSNWFNKSFNQRIRIGACFNKVETELSITSNKTEDDIDKSDYLNTISIEAKVGEETLNSNLHLYTNKVADLRFSRSKILCQGTFTSPFRYNIDLLQEAHAFAVENKYLDEIIKFIRDNLDESIEKIELITIEKESRFVVTSNKLNDVLDITKYGEGLQRIFEITLLMVFSKDGIICIDEIDSAIHKSLLVKFTNFIQLLANKYNVQVFLTTHSKECIDAFVQNDYSDDELMAYALEFNKEKELVCNYLEGNELKNLVESINVDIR
ncbi:hypothetical protein SF1_42310 [Sphingobacterium faecium NBRC 15299]|uniref:AAA family ATPase n=1 Tax=Sphingobacterium faecium TaxID=34087 RepID=UPI000D365A2B|nr:AAA family ATPase [Sphingobacterium faecium]PTX10195.1 AAA15 family ATPase/GTPase [Sphingobacterium faecium]GEM66249.1 hypothetical protein SF1_42310 [Sphingobacterium faecium NBRC 15299]